MTKKDNNDSTPIEFYIPPSNHGKGPRLPVPINQPNWVYKTNTYSNHAELTIARICVVIAIALGILLIASRLYTSPLWIGVVVFGVISFIFFRAAKTSGLQITKNEKNFAHPKRKDRKKLRRRKDYK